jgi:hypothetical protein
VVGGTLPSTLRTQPAEKVVPDRPKASMTAKELESVLLTPGLKLTTTTIFRRQIVKVTDEAIALHFLICGTLLGQSPTASPSRPAPARLTCLSASPSATATQINQRNALARLAAQSLNARANSLPVDYFDSPNRLSQLNGQRVRFHRKKQISDRRGGEKRPSERADAAGR